MREYEIKLSILIDAKNDQDAEEWADFFARICTDHNGSSADWIEYIHAGD